MTARLVVAHFALVAFLHCVAYAQDAVVYVDVAHAHSKAERNNEIEEVEKRYTPELEDELLSVQADVLLLYTEYSNYVGNDMKKFLKNITTFTTDTKRSIDRDLYYNSPDQCRLAFEFQLRKIENDAHRSATFSAENHNKFLLGHMVVFRMHLTKCEDFIRKCAIAVKNCGVPCEINSRVKRWRRQALEEIHRIRDDIQHTRRSYKDLVTHARRKLIHVRKQVMLRTRETLDKFNECIRNV